MTGVSVAERRAEIAAHEPGRNDAVLRQQRPVEPERRPQPRDFLLRRAFAEHRLRRIAGHEVDQREDERRDAEQHRNREQQPPEEVAEHTRTVMILPH